MSRDENKWCDGSPRSKSSHDGVIYVDSKKYDEGLRVALNKPLQPGMNHAKVGDKVRSTCAGYRGRIKEIQYTAPLQAVVDWEEDVDNGGTSTIQLHLLELVEPPRLKDIRLRFLTVMGGYEGEIKTVKKEIKKIEPHGHRNPWDFVDKGLIKKAEEVLLKVTQLDHLESQLRLLRRMYDECDLDVREDAIPKERMNRGQEEEGKAEDG